MIETILDESYLEKENVPIAKFWQRLLALFIDGAFFYLLAKILMLFDGDDFIYLISAFSVLVYRPFMEYLYGGTLGKMALKIKVVSTDLQAPSIAQVILRNGFGIVNQVTRFLFYCTSFSYFLPIYLWIYGNADIRIEVVIFFSVFVIDTLILFFNRNNQALHDLMAKTIVVKR